MVGGQDSGQAGGEGHYFASTSRLPFSGILDYRSQVIVEAFRQLIACLSHFGDDAI